ncbi:Ig-like V-type domain-containing protein FAM187A [Bufo gargarizans]|uniref:Ig-like V-type domain-containing protein FAM187A n=1 Tax=Bufo gargarizans TaxID=30331 RepID=UPI001CF11CF5|nr:Ig-like V-type domain-containing protein FAM187A [Bufo gargarizans]
MIPSFLPCVTVAFLLHLIPANSFAIVERDDIYRSVQCPAFLLFDPAAYLEDMTFELPCHCKPEIIKSVVWYYQKNRGNKKTRVLTDFNGTVQLDVENVQSSTDIVFRFSIRMFSLIVFKAQIEDSGNYMCGSKDGHFFYGYSVDIQDSKNAYVAFENQHGHPQQDLVSKYFVSFTTFWEWTVCDRCDVRGEQMRIGLCYINSTYLNPRFRAAPSDVTSCGSEGVPPKFKKLLSTRRPEIIVRSCMTPCHKPKKGILGKLSTLMHNIMKLKDYIPWLPKVPTQLHSHPLGSRLTIACPGAKPEQAVAWDKDDKRLYRTEYLIGINKSMRVFIDHGNHLNFRFVQYNDKGIYYCWLQGKMKAGFRLAVQKDPVKKRHFSDPESVFAMKTIGISYVFFFIIFILIHGIKCCFKDLKRLLFTEQPSTIHEDRT